MSVASRPSTRISVSVRRTVNDQVDHGASQTVRMSDRWLELKVDFSRTPFPVIFIGILYGLGWEGKGICPNCHASTVILWGLNLLKRWMSRGRGTLKHQCMDLYYRALNTPAHSCSW